MIDGSNTTHFGFTEIPTPEKVIKVGQIFDSVADRYDLMNDLMSLGIHRVWKRYAIRKLHLLKGDHLLDVAGGTGDLARLSMKRMKNSGRVTVCDINANMLIEGKRKLTDKGYVDEVDWVQGNAECLPFPNNHFHAVTIGFGIRNVTNIPAALKEMHRVLRPGGEFMCLEFSEVAIPVLKTLYDTYSFRLLPEIGQRVTGDRDAYQYLVESIRKFPNQKRFQGMMEEAGFYGVQYYNLSGGIAAIHIGNKV